jgi:signal transduction histidine kinase
VIKDEFLATLSHELRTPLNAIVGWAGLLRSGALDGERLTDAVERIERNSRALTRLVDDMLDVSAIISGKMSLKVRPLDPAAVVAAALEAVRPAAEARSIRIESDLSSDAGVVMGDPDRLRQVVWNLLSNAVRFTPPGGQVSVRLEGQDGIARLAVSDTGQGVDPAFLPHVFEPFRQADGSITRMHGGLGLGLAIVRRLVEGWGGRIDVESQVGSGTRIVVHLSA